jgi:hypothetical protein
MLFRIPVRHVKVEHDGWGFRSISDDIGRARSDPELPHDRWT